MSNVLVFNGHTIQTTNHNNQIWISSAELSKALGYKREDSVSAIYRRNEDEFTPMMALNVKLAVKGFGNGESEKFVRIFSLRGAHLVAMFAKTPIAKEFRKWVLDILDAEAAKVQLPAPTLTPEQQRILQKVVAAKTKDVVNRDKAFCYIYHKLKEHFRVAKYNQIPSERFEEAVNFTERLTLSDFEKYTGARLTEREHDAIHKINALSVELHYTVRDLIPLFDRVAEAKRLPAN